MELTLREQEVAGLVAEGLTAREVGLRLGISAQTVKNHKHTIYTKLDVRNSVQLTRVWLILMEGESSHED